MKLFQQLMLAPAALGLFAPMGAMAGELNFGGVSKYASADEQVTSISQFSDVYPTDWAYQALANLIERYGCVAGYPNGTFQGNRALSRYEAAALLNACLDRVTEITDEVRRLMKAFEKELAVVKARVDGLEAAVGELEATQFSTTTKLKGKVRFVQGSAYRGDGYVRFGRLKNVLKAAQLYGIRVYDGSTGGLQDRTVNKIKDGKSQGEAYTYYAVDPDTGAYPTKGGLSGQTVYSQPAAGSLTKYEARNVAFNTAWTGATPSGAVSGMSIGDATDSSAMRALSGNTFAAGNGNTAAKGVGSYKILLTPSIAALNTSNNNGTGTAYYTPDRSRMSLYFKDGSRTDNSFANTSGAESTSSYFLFSSQGIQNGLAPSAYLRARNFQLQDKFGNTQKLRVQTSQSGSSNYKAKSIQFDQADYGALVNLANKARRVKAYDYYVLPAANTTSIAGLTKYTKAAGVPDPIKIGDVARAYVGYQADGNAALITGAGSEGADDRGGNTGLAVTPGGFVQNNLAYNNVMNYLLAEYGSLNTTQRNTAYVKKAGQLFVRSLAAYPANKNGVADRNALTFSHDAQLNFNTSFTGKDKLNFRLRSNTIYGFAKRVNAPFADLAFDGSKPTKGKAKLYVDKLYYKFPVGDWGKVSFGTRAPQDSFLPSRGTMYTKDALLEFFNTSAGVFPSYTGTGAGVGISRFGGKKLKIANGTVGFGIGYLANEGDAMNPASYNYLQEGFMGRDTRFRLPVQLAWKSKDKKWLFTANYAYERGNNSMGKVGTELAKNPFGYSTLIESNQYGFTLAYKWSKQFQITGAYGGASMNSRYDSSVLGIKMASAGDSAQTSSWMIGLNFKDVFIQGNKAGFAIGGVPTVNSNDSGWGTDGSMPIALETWYQFQVTDNISVTPGVFWVSGQNDEKTGRYGQVTLDASNGDVWGGIVKTEFKF
ncbi:outer membrane porin [Synechococcus sp. Minos11]|uniref:iron uptake porin n=1 Tax=Synechococcus sp. Minos11 TaxID=221341 RepID=UPI0016454F89|nr:iron uptake porin [Synechococcus sp. Minos11]QNJ07767.1 outer membrane porin [Synechococcus sp. Minos11]